MQLCYDSELSKFKYSKNIGIIIEVWRYFVSSLGKGFFAQFLPGHVTNVMYSFYFLKLQLWWILMQYVMDEEIINTVTPASVMGKV